MTKRCNLATRMRARRYQEREFLKHYADITHNWEWEDFDEFMDKYGLYNNIEAFASWLTVTTYFHSIGALLKRKRIDLIIVDDLIRTTTIQFWEKIEPIVKEMRKRLDFPRFLWAVEYLYTEMKRMEQLEAASR